MGGGPQLRAPALPGEGTPLTESAKAERVLVTGVSGFIGSRVAARWAARGGEARGLVRGPIGLGVVILRPVVAGQTTFRAILEDDAGWFGVEVAPREPRSVYDHFRGRFASDRARAELGCAPRRSQADALEETRRYLVARGVVAPGDA